tara:strand:+ start:9342 stop:10487 length:1146 start_codon:yes stop_codon:yes gene_type:complete
MCKNADLFDINGANKLNDECVAEREEIVKFHIKNPKAIFICSTSSGKDSQAMYLKVCSIVPKNKIVVVHADLGVVEHDGVIHHINQTIEHKLNVVRNKYKDFIGMVLLRGMFPAAKYRQCTSDLKTNPIFQFIRAYMKENGYTIGFNVSGLRSEESTGRAMKNPLWVNKTLTLKTGNRTVFDWMPIFHYTERDVYEEIKNAGQVPHKAYGDRPEGGTNGNSRLSCKFCIMASLNDLRNAAANYTDHYHEMIALERVVDHTMFGKTKTIHTDRELAKGTSLGDGKVTSCTKNNSKRAVMPYKCTVFIPVALSDKVGAPFDEIKVQQHVNRLKALRVQYKFEEKLRKDAKAEKRMAAKKAVGGKNTKRDESTIDFLEALNLTA